MAADNRRTIWLGVVLIAVLIGAMVVRSMNQAPAVAPPAPRPAAPAAASADATHVEVRLEALARERDEPHAGGRDPFRFQPSLMAEPVRVERLPGVPDDQVGAPPPRTSAGPPPPPPISLKFIGIVQKADGTRIAVLTDGRRPISGREGEEIEGRYRILRIGDESLEIAYLDGRGRQTIRLTGQ